MGARNIIFSMWGLWFCLAACAVSGGNELGRSSEPVPGNMTNRAAVKLPPLTFRLSGGLVGRMESLEISADGLAVWSDQRIGATYKEHLSTSDLEILQASLAEIPEVVIVTGNQSFKDRCRDCFEYRLELSSSGEPRRIVVRSDRLAGSQYRGIISTLIAFSDDFKRKTLDK